VDHPTREEGATPSAEVVGKRSFRRFLFHMSPLCSLVVVTLLALGIGRAAGAAEKIGFFDPQRLLADSQRLNTLRAEFEIKRMAKEKEVETTQKALQDFMRAAKDGAEPLKRPGGIGQMRGSSLPAEQFPEAKALNETLNRLKREALELQSQAQEGLRSQILTAVREFARQYGYAVIFDRTRAGVVHIEEERDITSALIQWIDRSE
jgi:Skp family chaperone for outer membrane proteins